ncbi:Coenzyme F420 hydrogenase/dehydrogenase, beta subunit C-terminal domain, partial [Bacteroidales bacterium OttesenSCG-928-I21]|nr:Coenzyme F420 hydrogenase/dehydrogenase, beta subunit C-terminal domain [Bacteroidales bacterium OttesenSCG-928-I21]
MKQITTYCVGCRACEQKCPKSCIAILPDKEGFLQPQIDESLCVDCNLCIKVCPQNHPPEKNNVKRALAIRYKDNKTLYGSASGGAFIGIAKRVIQQGGIVFGAVYDNNLVVVHARAESLDELKGMQSSKYVQSDTQNSYSVTKCFLDKGQIVLYTGTPCQIGGLKKYLGKSYSNLLTIDLICHGVPSPKLFNRYLIWLENTYGGKIIAYDFRSKKTGWGLGYKAKTKTKTKTKYISGICDPYYYHFLKGNTYRECCYSCNYCTPERISDITIGDYWGIQKEHPNFFSTKGVSCMLINTDKGNRLFNEIVSDYYCLNSSFEKIAKHNHNLQFPTKRNIIRDTIYQSIDDVSVEFYFKEIMQYPISIVMKIKNILP